MAPRQVRDVVELGITLDERVADGFYFGRSLKIVQHLMSHRSCWADL